MYIVYCMLYYYVCIYSTTKSSCGLTDYLSTTIHVTFGWVGVLCSDQLIKLEHFYNFKNYISSPLPIPAR